MMTTTNNTNTNTNTAQRKRTPEEEDALAKEKEELQRDYWSNRVHSAIWRHMKRQLLASGGYSAARFVPFYKEDVTRFAAMVEVHWRSAWTTRARTPSARDGGPSPLSTYRVVSSSPRRWSPT